MLRLFLILLLVLAVAIVVFRSDLAAAVGTPNPQGGSVGYYTLSDEQLNFSNSVGEVVPVISLTQLPAGNYFVTVTAWIHGTSGCSLDPTSFEPNSPVGYWSLPVDTSGFNEAITLDQQKDITLYCQQGADLMQVFKVRLAASKVQFLNITP